MSASLGAMGSLLRKLHVAEYQVTESAKEGIGLLKQDLEVVNAAMVDLSETETCTTMARHWMNQVRDLSYDIEDYIDNTMPSSSSSSYSDSSADLEPVDPGRIEEFRVSVREARERHQIYELGRCTCTPPRCGFVSPEQRRAAPAPDWKGTSLVGIGKSKIELLNMLSDEAEPKLKVVSILGVGGVGKTALAKQVFRELGGRFGCRAFVQASRMPDTKRILRGILSQVRRHGQLPADCCTVQVLIDEIRQHIQHKRYFILIDDLWETSSWDIVSSAFPKGECCCRVLTTTNIEEVALECCDYQYDDIYKMKPLSRDDSANLFFSSVFGSEHNCSEELKNVSYEIVRNCGGLPLGIMSIARFLANEVETLELWQHVKKLLSFSTATSHTSEDMLRNIVCLCYKSLPRHLKTCLQYLTMYPEGCIIWKADLVKQWTAEGFIRETEGEDTNAVADSYFDELVSRGIVQPNRKTYSDEVLSCTVHHMVFDVIKGISIEENFTTALDYSQSITKLPFKVRRLSLHVSNTKYATKPSNISLSQARSLNFYGLAGCLPSTLEFKQLRVLILQLWGDQEEFDLRGIFRLLQLRYVQVTTDMIVKLPANIQRLQYLETLQLNARVENVPSDIVHLPKLLHFRLRDVTLPDNIGCMVSLCTLESLDLSNNSEQNVWGLGEMTNLQDLHLNCSELSDCLKRNLTALASSLGKFGKLRTLVLAPSSGTSMYMDCSRVVSSPPLSLQRLELLPPICIFSRLPEWIGQLKKLRILKIVVRELLSSDVHSLAMLQELNVLSLDVQQSLEETIVFNHKAFPVLRYFKFRCAVVRLAFQAEAMPNLQKLKIEFKAHSGEQYGDMLAGIEHLLNLQEIIGRIGAAADAEESDKTATESALSDATKKLSSIPRFNIRWIHWVEEDVRVFPILDLPGRSSSSDIEIMCYEDSPSSHGPSADVSLRSQAATWEGLDQPKAPGEIPMDPLPPRPISARRCAETESIITRGKARRRPRRHRDGPPDSWERDGDREREEIKKEVEIHIEGIPRMELADTLRPLSLPIYGRRREGGSSEYGYTCGRGRAVPRFGEWDSSSRASAAGYTQIFNRAREEKKSLKEPSGPGLAEEPSGPGKEATHGKGSKASHSAKSKWSCFRWCNK
ncbi:disease resistance protein RGA5-like isoform X2 [Oryza brachyantha]|uniref:disease resistance protein RGA5-like isoform X2 n=1 Tax=Oryza brachyantha TaxID=4533 RepID=UPI001ADA9394|nr:disease resistance protein RGA5-like isoform X2 [Oryza brachyantha]